MSSSPAQPRVVRKQLGPACRISSFEVPGLAREVHLCIEPTQDDSFEHQLEGLTQAYHGALETLDLPRHTAVFRRCFISDAANQLERVMASPVGLAVPAAEAAAVSCIQQPPLSGRKIALWAYHIGDVKPADRSMIPMPSAGAHARTLVLQRKERSLLWTTQLTGKPLAGEDLNPCTQTDRLFAAYGEMLGSHQASLLNGTVRTWVFVQQVDTHYGEMVKARRELFEKHGLTPQTHYIVSTGIEGRTINPESLVTLDAVAVAGLDEEQTVYLDSLDHLNRTSDYGVTFERAMRLNYADRSHIYVAGTASIAPDGRVLHVGKIEQQVERTLENISALLKVGNSSLDDVAAMIVYLRDLADTDRVRASLETNYPGLPYAMVLAPVCRPTWLVEIEALAIIPNDDPRWPAY